MRLMEGRRQVRQFPRPPQPHEISAAEVTAERPADSGEPATVPMATAMVELVIDQTVEPESFGEGLPSPPESAPVESSQIDE